MKFLTSDEVTIRLREATKKRGAVVTLAKRLKMTTKSIYNMRSGRRPVSTRVAAELGIRKKENRRIIVVTDPTYQEIFPCPVLPASGNKAGPKPKRKLIPYSKGYLPDEAR